MVAEDGAAGARRLRFTTPPGLSVAVPEKRSSSEEFGAGASKAITERGAGIYFRVTALPALAERQENRSCILSDVYGHCPGASKEASRRT
jgi:hypothetical protein